MIKGLHNVTKNCESTGSSNCSTINTTKFFLVKDTSEQTIVTEPETPNISNITDILFNFDEPIRDLTETTVSDNNSSGNISSRPTCANDLQVLQKTYLNKDEKHSLTYNKPDPLQSLVSQNLSSTMLNVANSFNTSSLTKVNIDWQLKAFPFQVTTVGYAFPQFDIIESNSMPKIKELPEKTISIPKKISPKLNKTIKPIENFIEKVDQALQTQTKNAIKNASCQSDTFLPTVSMPANEIMNEGKHSNTTNLNSDSTSSLDILVSLLNEIQNITACQTQIMNMGNDGENIYFQDDSQNVFTDLDGIRHYSSSNSLNSLYVSNDDMRENVYSPDECQINNTTCSATSIKCSNEQLSSHLKNKAYVNCSTSVSLLNFGVDNSTNVTNSLLSIPNPQSNKSPLSCNKVSSNYKKSKKNNHMYVKKIEKNVNDIFTIHQNKFVDESTIKVKRDILVTMYSILIFTVFAALTFPEFVQDNF